MIDIHELSISDWIVGGTFDGKVAQRVSSLTEMSVDTNIGGLYFPKEVEPLKLDARMLRKNDFVPYINEKREKNYIGVIALLKVGDSFRWNGIEVKYVHVLQNILRVMGFNKLANTFEI